MNCPNIRAFDFDFKIAVDYDFTMKAIFRHHCKTQYINEVFAVFSTGGVSSDGDLREREKREIQRTVFTRYEIFTIKALRCFKKLPVKFQF